MKWPFIILASFSLAVAVTSTNHEGSLTKANNLKNNRESIKSDISVKESPSEPDMSKREDPLVKFLIEKAKEILDSFNLHLKSFIKQRNFEFGQFKLVLGKFQAQLASVVTFADTSKHSSQELSAQLTFTEHMLRVMINSAELLEFYAPYKGKAQNLVHKLIQLNIRLFKFQDSKGVPDPGIKWYARTVTRLNDRLRAWDTEFYSMDDVPLSIEIAFNDQFFQAKQSLYVLGKYVPSDTD